MRLIMLVFALAAPPALAEGYSAHHMTKLFVEQPCGEVFSAIDWLDSAEPPDLLDEASVDDFMQRIGMTGMAWGFLLGIDLERGGLHLNGQTTLERLRLACAANPTLSAKAILDRF